MAVSLFGLFFAGSDPHFFGERYPDVFAATAAAYLVFAVVFRLAIIHRWVAAEPQIITQVIVEIGAIVTLMHASGGIGSGLGGLLIVFVGASSLVVSLQFPAFLAAVAALVILGEQLFSQLSGVGESSNYSAAGILGATIFAIAFAANLSELNEYIVQHLRESIVVVDSKNEIRLVNTSAARLLGAPDSCHGTALEQISPELAQFLVEWRQDLKRTSHHDLTVNASDDATRITTHLAPLGKGSERKGPVLIFL